MSTRDHLRQQITDKAIVHGRVTLSSGKEADYYVDLRRITLDAAAAPLIGPAMLELTKDLEYDAVGGLTLGADPVRVSMLHAAAARRPTAGRVRRTQGGQGARPAAADRGSGRQGPPGARGRGHLDDRRVGAHRGRGAARGRRRGGRGRGDRGPAARRARWSPRGWSTARRSGSRTSASADAGGTVLIVLLAVLVGGGIFYFNYLAAKKRREVVRRVRRAAGLGVSAVADNTLAGQWSGTPFQAGDNRQVRNVLSGAFNGRPDGCLRLQLPDAHDRLARPAYDDHPQVRRGRGATAGRAAASRGDPRGDLRRRGRERLRVPRHPVRERAVQSGVPGEGGRRAVRARGGDAADDGASAGPRRDRLADRRDSWSAGTRAPTTRPRS